MNITPTQYRILRAIEEHIDANGYSPTQTYIAGVMGCCRQNIYRHISKMQDRGILTRMLGTANSIKLLQNSKDFD